MIRIYCFGIPKTCGGMNDEMGHTVLMWSRAGYDVSCIWLRKCKCHGSSPSPEESNPWMARLAEAGVKLIETESGHLNRIPGLRGSLVWGPCASHMCHNWRELKSLGCKLIWSPGMCFVMPYEVEAFKNSPPDVLHCQSEYQKSQIADKYKEWGCDRCEVIHGAFDGSLYPFAPLPHEPGTPFRVCRIARGHRSKWNEGFWHIGRVAREKGVDLRVTCQAWDYDLSMHCGHPPEWAETQPADHESTASILARSHACICPNMDWLTENWPRIGLEAMSAGVPLIVDDRGGWPEMCGETAMLCDCLDDFANCIVYLSKNEDVRWKRCLAGAVKVRQYSQDAIVERWREVISTVF